MFCSYFWCFLHAFLSCNCLQMSHYLPVIMNSKKITHTHTHTITCLLEHHLTFQSKQNLPWKGAFLFCPFQTCFDTQVSHLGTQLRWKEMIGVHFQTTLSRIFLAPWNFSLWVVQVGSSCSSQIWDAPLAAITDPLFPSILIHLGQLGTLLPFPGTTGYSLVLPNLPWVPEKWR